MNIVMVHPNDIFSPVEPWTRRIKSLAAEFSRRGHQVTLVYFTLATNRFPPKRQGHEYELIALNRALSPAGLLKNIRILTNISRRADVVHFQKCHYYSALPAVLAAYFNQKPLHYDWDDWEEMIWYESCGRGPQALFIGFLFKACERLLVRIADTVSVASNKLKELALEYGKGESSVCLAPVGVDLGEFTPDLDARGLKEKLDLKPPVVVYVGQLHGAQYIGSFIEAANIVLHKCPQVKFLIIGGGSREKDLRRLAFERGIEDKVIFTGAVPHSDIPYYIACADICVAPFEDTSVTRCKSPLKIVEYMAMSKAVIAGNVGEVKNMLGGVGVLVKPGDTGSLAGALLKLLADQPLRESLGRYARLRVKNSYTWDKTADSLLAAYKAACGYAS